MNHRLSQLGRETLADLKSRVAAPLHQGGALLVDTNQALTNDKFFIIYFFKVSGTSHFSQFTMIPLVESIPKPRFATMLPRIIDSAVSMRTRSGIWCNSTENVLFHHAQERSGVTQLSRNAARILLAAVVGSMGLHHSSLGWGFRPGTRELPKMHYRLLQSVS